MNKIIATRIILFDPIKQAILGVHPTGRSFKNKEGGVNKGTWNIPGGEIDPDEDKEVCLIREIKEECNIDLVKSKLRYLGFYDYSEAKDLHFYFYIDDSLNLKKLKCESYFETPNGKMLPEVNSYAFFNIESELDMFFPVLQKVLQKVFKDYPDLFK